MDIKTIQLKNTKIEDISSSSVRMAAKVAENGKSFIDEMIDLPKLNAENNSQKNNIDNKQVGQKFGNDKSFEFVSKPSNSFASTMNKQNLSVQERQIKHKVAEKELVDEIVLMNNKQNTQQKDGVKNDLNKAQISVAKKSENQIDEENQEIENEMKSFEIKNQNNEIDNLKFVSPENLEMTQNIEEELVFSENNQIEEIKGKPETFENVELEPLKSFDNLQAVEVKEFQPEEKQLEIVDKIEVQPKSSEIKEFQPEEKQLVTVDKTEVQPKSSEVKEFQPEEKQLEIVDKIEVQPKVSEIKEFQSEEKQLVTVDKTEVQPKVSEVKEFQLEEKQLQHVNDKFSDELQNEIKFVENKSEKIEFIENVVNNKNIEFKDKKLTEKPVINKISDTVKHEIKDVPENISMVKDIADDVNVKPVEMQPLPTDNNIKIIKMEMINPLVELNNSLNTNKTSDIVKFIDANLSTETSKSSKMNASKKADTLKKSLSEKSIKMTEADAKFFSSLIETNQQVIEGSKSAEQINNNVMKNVETAHSAQVSKALLNALKESQETNKPFRLDIDKDISIILRVNKNGAISAEFLPGDEAVEQYLKANIPLLKQKFSDEGLEYDSLSYRQNKKENSEERSKQNRGNKKENGYE